MQGRQGVIIDGKIEEHGSLMGDTMGGSSREVGIELKDGSKGMIEITISEAGMMWKEEIGTMEGEEEVGMMETGMMEEEVGLMEERILYMEEEERTT